jgi:hypothetical protein
MHLLAAVAVVVVVVVVVLSQTFNLRLTRAAMMSVWIRTISYPKPSNRRA